MNPLAEIYFNTMLELAKIVGQNDVLVKLSDNESDRVRRSRLLQEATEKLEECKLNFRKAL
jgi:hypothetical protein